MPSESVRRRKLTGAENERPMPRRKASKQQNDLQFSFICLLLCVIILIFFLGMYTDSFHPIIDGIAVQLGYQEKQYAVILDAGSTGSRVLAYEFHRGYLDGRLVLDNELFKQLKPGLSAFADKPNEGAQQIEKLLQEAKNVIPNAYWGKTPVVLKATAGLRLLDPTKADGLLKAVRGVFRKSGFLIEENAVEIMEGVDEGIFSWFTVNFLLGRLNGKNTVAALDLGGGSTQVTFAPKDLTQNIYDGFIHEVPTTGDHVKVFTHSYLGLGLHAVRHAVFTNGLPENQTAIDSECVNPIVKTKLFRYSNREFLISGRDNKKSTAENPEVDFEACVDNVRSKVVPLVRPKPVTLKQHQIAAFSYYFERAIESGLVDPTLGGEIKVGDFYTKAREVCAIPNTDQPFMCLDLTFIAILLQDGYGLKPQAQIKVKIAQNNLRKKFSYSLFCPFSYIKESTTTKSRGHSVVPTISYQSG
ncbi:ectonucleoside triphosphate diphosphohydrolase 5 isoform X2 [Lutzomyia longipalpis]|uniref:ectonucleoside triphosphate diphosphohydrolase 5 isoform X2 n=1 Tax=Lutzomyia longipalpis TaxID=7200 RepID=UPI002483F868|nr:ectonucleoside triphosphate diphosphohydrolase 5 isoform X2 [Lutzomyia longipalpis]